ncbi:MAG: hypothetical protein QM772_12060 [Ottowia sp.]|uniref:hypothetical protein n=1 Tax=Ottowia sp. TaxID=1898956 RepID=UPI0039E40C1E
MMQGPNGFPNGQTYIPQPVFTPGYVPGHNPNANPVPTNVAPYQPNPAPGTPLPNPLPPPGTTANTLPPPNGTPSALPPANTNVVPPGTPQPLAQVVAPATALAGSAVTIGPAGAAGQPANGPMTTAPMTTAPVARGQPAAGAPVPGLAQAPVQVAPGLANPRAAQAAAAAMQGPGVGQLPPVAANPAAVRAGQAQGALPVAGQAQQAAAVGAAAGRGVPTGVQAVAQAQVALAQTLGRVTAGQMTAGGAAVALAQAQLALRASRLAQMQIQVPGLAQGQRGAAGLPGQAGQALPAGPAQRAVAGAASPLGARQAPGQRGASGAAAQAAPAPAQTVRAGQLPGGAARAGGAGEAGAQQAPVGAGAAMPRRLATALAMAPKLRRRGSHDRVEKVDRFTPRAQTPEMEDEDFWDALGDEDEPSWAADAPPDEARAGESAAEAAVQHYRALHVWLQANERQVLLRELALGRRVLVLAPPDQTHLRLMGHVLWPDPAGPVRAAGARGRAWPLAARWAATLPADGSWREWRLRQWVDAGGGWHVSASQPDRHTPRLLLAGEALAGEALAATPPAVGEYITVAEPRRLRRLMGAQWTMRVLRVPVPLDGVGAQGAVAGCR